MSTLPQIEAGLATLCAALTGLQTVWENRAQPQIKANTRAICKLSLGATTTYGEDDSPLVWNDTDQVYESTAVGIRNLPLRIKVLCFRQTDSENASAYLERARLRLAWESSNFALAAIDCGKQFTGPVIPLDTPIDDHIASMAALDLTLTVKLEETDPTSIPYIAQITGTQTLGDAAPVPYTLDIPSP